MHASLQEEASPPAIGVFKDDKIVAYVFSTLDMITDAVADMLRNEG